jgi:hypothetical protein
MYLVNLLRRIRLPRKRHVHKNVNQQLHRNQRKCKTHGNEDDQGIPRSGPKYLQHVCKKLPEELEADPYMKYVS